MSEIDMKHIYSIIKIFNSYIKKCVQVIKDGLEKLKKKEDTDNISKIILDSLNRIAYKDDSQIVKLRGINRYIKE